MISKSCNSCAAQILGTLAARGLLPGEIRRLTRRNRGVSVALLPAPRSWAAGHKTPGCGDGRGPALSRSPNMLFKSLAAGVREIDQ